MLPRLLTISYLSRTAGLLLAAAVLAACGASSAATARNGHEQLLTPSRPTPAAVVTVQLTGVTAADGPIGGGAAVLRRFTNGQWMTIYTLRLASLGGL